MMGTILAEETRTIPSTCPMPSNNPANQRTLCTLYTYDKLISTGEYLDFALAPAYKTHATKVTGKTAEFYFECHYFDVDSSTGTPPWTAISHVALMGTARKINGQWMFWQAKGTNSGSPGTVVVVEDEALAASAGYALWGLRLQLD